MYAAMMSLGAALLMLIATGAMVSGQESMSTIYSMCLQLYSIVHGLFNMSFYAIANRKHL